MREQEQLSPQFYTENTKASLRVEKFLEELYALDRPIHFITTGYSHVIAEELLSAIAQTDDDSWHRWMQADLREQTVIEGKKNADFYQAREFDSDGAEKQHALIQNLILREYAQRNIIPDVEPIFVIVEDRVESGLKATRIAEAFEEHNLDFRFVTFVAPPHNPNQALEKKLQTYQDQGTFFIASKDPEYFATMNKQSNVISNERRLMLKTRDQFEEPHFDWLTTAHRNIKRNRQNQG